MANKVKTLTKCEDCKNYFKTSFGSNVSTCPNCMALKKESVKKMATDLKEEILYTKKIEFDLTSSDQKLTAVKAQGEVFASRGGTDLMITEFVENSIDAIKKRKVMEVFPKVLKNLNFDEETEKIAIEKYTLPITEFQKKYPRLSNDKSEHLTSLQNEIFKTIKSENQRREYVIVELDDEKREVRIIDSGTGIEHPIHICEKPFVSLKTGEDYSTGQFGRGSQVFREFCGLMEFYSIRDKISKKEEENISDENWDRSKFDEKSIHIKFPHDYPGGHYSFINSKNFKEYSNFNRIGTVVILSKWKQNYYDELSKHISKLERRLVHHFGFALDDIYNIGLKLKHKKKEIEILQKNYEDNPKIQGLFDLPPITIRTELGQELGKVEFFIYKTVRSYSDAHKEPFLVVNGRPLGDTSIADMPRMSQHKQIWESNTITGYVVCNAVTPNQMRIGLADTDATTPFYHAMTSASIDLKGLNTIWKNELSSAIDKTMMNEVVDTVTRFLSKKGIKFNFTNPLQKGIQKDSKKQGDEITEERVSNEDRGPNQGLIDSEEGEEVLVGYKKTKTDPKEHTEWDEDTIIVPHGGKKKDGDTIISVKVKKSLVSKGGRKIRKSYSGPDLDFNVDEDCGDELSYFESDPPTVMIQSEHPAWKKLSKKARDQVNGEKFEKEKKDYLLERYLWELMNNKAVQKDVEINDEERKNMFWTYYHDLLDTK
ncbi:MAG: hypothetical protein ACW9W3_05900 [Candidatus Nitrosopumilus sp. bin_68KS]